MKEWERQQKLRYDEQHPEFIGLVMTDKNRWDYQKVVDKQSTERAIKLDPTKKVEQCRRLENVIMDKLSEEDLGFITDLFRVDEKVARKVIDGN